MINTDKYKDKNIIIYGLGKTGISTYQALKESCANIFIWDDDDSVRQELSKSGMEFINPNQWPWEKMDILIPSPGIPINYGKNSFIVEKALKKGSIEILGDIELFYQDLKSSKLDKKIIAITGTNGKSTFVTLLHQILKEAGEESYLLGNIGNPILSIEPRDNNQIYIIEISSFQIELIDKFKPDIAVLLNISEDHKERYSSFDEYRLAKIKIFSNMNSNDYAILNESLGYEDILDKINPLPKKIIVKDDNSFTESKFDLSNFSYKNLLPALFTVTDIINIERKHVFEVLLNFKNLNHRTKEVYANKEIRFIDDSKATNPAAANFAINQYKDIYLILGGLSKQNDLRKLDLSSKNINKAFFIGSSSDQLSKIAPKDLDFEVSRNLEHATKSAYIEALKNKKGCVLLSPGCSSLDEYNNFQERGDDFAKIVNNLDIKC